MSYPRHVPHLRLNRHGRATHAWPICALLLLLSGCDDLPAENVSATEAPQPSPTPAIVLTDDQRSELDACERAYINRFGSPMMNGQASVACNTAYMDLPQDTVSAKYAKAMYDAAEARSWSDDKERKRLEGKAHDLAVAQFTLDSDADRTAKQ